MNVEFTLYARPSGSIGAIPLEHTYIVSADGHNWNCFGAGKGSDQSRIVRKVNGSSKWASLIYGPDEGPIDSTPAAGLRVRYDGVCQNAANRILVLAGDDIDARGTQGNAFATLMYGKFGFNIPQYIETVKSTGAKLLTTNPGEITPSDIQAVLDRINRGITPDAELAILHADAEEQLGTSLLDITDAQANAFRPIYGDYQNDRSAAFATAASKANVGDQIAYGPLKSNLAAPWAKCVDRLVTTIGPDQFKMMFGVEPGAAKQVFA